ncbi:3-keto-steroid reductase [Aspergillus lucknowensis]|uniref:3-ketosteroid reductase n=1 Tax=Aspergillus lucknowensis TaxID=176173 RepID=A0ABR4LPU1_9EURO
MNPSSVDETGNKVVVLVTGANSGLGYSICCRLADEFLTSRQNDNRSLTVIFTTRSTRKGNDTLRNLQNHLRTSVSEPPAAARVTFFPENVDLCDLLSVRALSRRLNKTFPKLDAVVLNAGIGGWTGINWPVAIWGVLTDLVQAVTWPSYKVAPAGLVLDRQTRTVADKEPQLATVFCANVFGHYMLAHNVMPLLHRSGSPNGPGRVVWVSSLEASSNHFDIDDLQGLRTLAPYESSKALTDILSLTSHLPSTAPWVKSFYSTDFDNSTSNPATTSQPPNTYVSHPGICGTGILPLAAPLFYAMLASFWLARLLGSPWHTMSTYMGACAPVWLALSAQSVLDAAEAPYLNHGGGRAKWGSSTNRSGLNQPVSTEVDGWGHGGVVGPAVVEEDRNRRRKRGAVDLTLEEKERFEDLGRECWRHMEELRMQWDELLDEEEVRFGRKE